MYRNIKAIRADNDEELSSLETDEQRQRRLVELNAIAQAHAVLRMKNVQEAMVERGVQVYALVYDVACGKFKQLDLPEDKTAKAFELVSKF